MTTSSAAHNPRTRPTTPLAGTALEATTDTGTLDAQLEYLVGAEGKPKIFMALNHAEENERTGRFEAHTVAVDDAHDLPHPPSLDVEGFELRKRPSAVRDFFDDADIEAVHYPEVIDLLKSATGAAEVVVFDHTLRIQDDGLRHATARRSPVSVVHNDYTEKSAPQRVRDLMGARADEVLGKRYAFVNAWRSIGDTAERKPLAVADARTMAAGDFIATDLVYTDRVGEIYQIAHADRQHWYYYSGMSRDDALLLKCFDSATDGRARYTAHGAFENPAAPAGTPPRESIEVRTLLIFDDEDRPPLA